MEEDYFIEYQLLTPKWLKDHIEYRQYLHTVVVYPNWIANVDFFPEINKDIIWDDLTITRYADV